MSLVSNPECSLNKPEVVTNAQLSVNWGLSLIKTMFALLCHEESPATVQVMAKTSHPACIIISLTFGEVNLLTFFKTS